MDQSPPKLEVHSDVYYKYIPKMPKIGLDEGYYVLEWIRIWSRPTSKRKTQYLIEKCMIKTPNKPTQDSIPLRMEILNTGGHRDPQRFTKFDACAKKASTWINEFGDQIAYKVEDINPEGELNQFLNKYQDIVE